jgi:glycyl-tRNA synthetase
MLKENLKNVWWDKFISRRDDIYPIDSSVIINPKVWEASGHVDNFADVMVEDVVNHKRYRADHLIEEYFERKGKEIKVDGKTESEMAVLIKDNNIKSPDGNDLTSPKKFNNLFKTEIGIISGEKNTAYLRGEIAQGLFINFKNILDSFSPKLPFGIGQAGKVFRNEITAGKFTFRTLEFDLMEFEYFFDPKQKDWNELFDEWKIQIQEFAESVGIKKEKLKWRPHEEYELSHYSSKTEDLEYKFPWGFKEMFAIAYRSNVDLKNHSQKSGKNLEYIRPDGSKLIPHVVEPTFGLSRLVTIILMDAYCEEEVKGKTRVVLKLDKKIAPVKIAIFPLQKDNELRQKAKEIYQQLDKIYDCEFDDSGNIGKMYRKQDEIGTPYCITIDYDSLKNQDVTIRERDTMEQERIKIKDLEIYFQDKLK